MCVSPPVLPPDPPLDPLVLNALLAHDQLGAALDLAASMRPSAASRPTPRRVCPPATGLPLPPLQPAQGVLLRST